MKYIPFLLLLAIVINSNAQTETVKTPQIYQFVEQMPVAGYNMMSYISENVHYPDSAIIKNIQGRVLVKFVVNEDGSISDCKVASGIGGGCDEEALRVIKKMPPWKPGRNAGKAIKVYFTQPISFKLEEPDSTQKLEVVYQSADSMPYPRYDFTRYLEGTLRYPEKPRDANIQGKIVLKFIVGKDGHIYNCQVANPGNKDLDMEALRVISQMPPWKPAIKDGKPVNCWQTRPIIFKLE
jgi:TonB family protein